MSVRTYGLTHVALAVRNPKRSLEFYRAVLGVVPVYEDPEFIQAQTPGSRDVLVFETEPLPAESPLRGLDNVVFTDHAGWYSEESVVELKTKAARNAAAVLLGGVPPYPVNDVAAAPRTRPSG